MTVYYRGSGKAQLKAAPRVQICVPCLIRAMAGSLLGKGQAGSKLWSALRQSIAYRFGSMIEGEEVHVDNPEFWRELRESLPFPSQEEADR